MPEHRHTADGRREVWGRVTFREVVDEVLDLVNQIEERHAAEAADGEAAAAPK
jgi:hypothetical protein